MFSKHYSDIIYFVFYIYGTDQCEELNWPNPVLNVYYSILLFYSFTNANYKDKKKSTKCLKHSYQQIP